MAAPLSLVQLQRTAHRLRAESDALIVLVIRADDVAFSVDPAVSPRDAGETIEREIPSLVQHLSEQLKRGR